MENVKKTVARNLIALRESYGESQNAFARRCGVPQRTYNDMERAEKAQNIENLQIIAERCHLDTWQLFVRQFDPKNPPLVRNISQVEQAFYDRINKMLDSADQ